MRADTIVAYTYKAEILCPSCTLEAVQGPDRDPWCSVEHQLFLTARHLGIDYEDPYSYDSDDFPKAVFADQTLDNERCEASGEEIP